MAIPEEHRDRMKKKRHAEKSPDMSVCQKQGIYINKTTFDADITNEVKEDFLLVPPVSTTDFG